MRLSRPSAPGAGQAFFRGAQELRSLAGTSRVRGPYVDPQRTLVAAVMLPPRLILPIDLLRKTHPPYFRPDPAARPEITFLALQLEADHGGTPFGSDDPGAQHPGRVVSHVLEVAAFQLRDPMALFILVIADNGTVHEHR